MIGYFNKLKKIDLSENKKPEKKNDKAFFFVIAFFAVIIIFTLVRASYDKVTQEQLESLKISVFDIITFFAAMAGYFITKKRGKK